MRLWSPALLLCIGDTVTLPAKVRQALVVLNLPPSFVNAALEYVLSAFIGKEEEGIQYTLFSPLPILEANASSVSQDARLVRPLLLRPHRCL